VWSPGTETTNCYQRFCVYSGGPVPDGVRGGKKGKVGEQVVGSSSHVTPGTP